MTKSIARITGRTTTAVVMRELIIATSTNTNTIILTGTKCVTWCIITITIADIIPW